MLQSCGLPSINTVSTSFKIGRVVKNTKIEQTKVVMGSAITQSLRIVIIIAAISTPIDCMMSPRTWIKVARIFTFAFSLFFFLGFFEALEVG